MTSVKVDIDSSASPQIPEQPQKRVAFGGFVKPEMYDVFSEYDLEAVTDAEKNWVSAERFTATVFAPPKDAKLVVDGIGLNAYEYGLVARSPVHLAKTAMAGTLKDNEIDDERLAASERSQIHTLKGKRDYMAAHVEKMQTSHAMIKELYFVAKRPGYALKTPQEMKELISTAWLEFQTILDVAHVQRKWDDEKRQKVEAALISRLTQGGQRDRVGNWWTMIELADKYLGARVHLFNNRIRKVEQLLPPEPEEIAVE